MAKSQPVYTLISTDDKHDPKVEEFDMFAALKIRMKGVQDNDPQFKLLVDGRPVTFEWGEPEFEARVKAKANGAGAVVSQ